MVGHELDVDKSVADDICEDEDGALGRAVGGVGEVGFRWEMEGDGLLVLLPRRMCLYEVDCRSYCLRCA